MNKRWIIAGMTVTLLLGACSKKEEEVPKENVPVEKKVDKEVVQEVLGLTQEQADALKLNAKWEIVDGTLQVVATLENTSNDAIPFLSDGKKVFVTTVLDVEEKELAQEVMVQDTRTSLNKKETITWEYEYEIGDKYGEYFVRIEVPLLDEKGKVMKEAFTKTVEVYHEQDSKKTYGYTPRTDKKLIYTNEDGSGVDVTEQFLYFENGYAQAHNSSLSGNVVYYTDDTGYYRAYTEVSSRTLNIINDIAPTNQLLLPLPVKEGQEWQSDGVKHKVVEDNITIKTPYGSLKGVSVVEANIGQKLRFYYHPDFGMVRTDVADADGNFRTLYELKAVE